MDLRRATLLLILGSAYTVVHKAVQLLFPAMSRSGAASAVMSLLWVLATFALAVFAFEFLREVRPRDRRLRYSLVSVIVFTAGVIASKLPLWPGFASGLGHRLLIGGASALNALALLVFAASLARLVAKGSPLRAPLSGLIWGLGITLALGVASVLYFSLYLVTGVEVEPLPFLRPLAMLSFLLTYGMTLWFLVRLRRIETYVGLVPRQETGPSAA